MTLPLLGSYQQPHFSDPTLPYRVKRVVNVNKIHAMTLFYKYLGRTPNNTNILNSLRNEMIQFENCKRKRITYNGSKESSYGDSGR